MFETGIKILSKEQILDLNRQGHNLDASGKTMYRIGFVLDDTQNNAGDPEPFKVRKSAVEKIVKRGLNRPWIPGKKGMALHIRPKEDATDDEILEFQKKFAGGEMVDYVMNDEGNRAWGIFKIYPEFEKMFENDEVPEFLSPMIGNWKLDKDTNEIIDGELLHVHSVGNPGYDRAYAKFVGTCNGPIDKCMRELRPLAAAGLLEEWRNNSCPCPKNFLNTKYGLGASGMSATEPTGQQPPKVMSPEELTAAVLGLQSDVKKIMEAVTGQGAPAAAPAVAAAGKEKDESETIKKIQAELAEIKKSAKEEKELAEKKAKQIEEKERKRQARIIAAGELLLEKSITEDKREEREKYYFELKGKDGETLQDLTALADNYESRLQKLIPETDEDPIAIAAAAARSDEYDLQGKTEPDFDNIESSITEEN